MVFFNSQILRNSYKNICIFSISTVTLYILVFLLQNPVAEL
ncbi:unnamed protein product [Meloidogyne enterolobii]|uniref:Uncharacterized protein n=1 Tax=Meloidogyne enterolobii TaxID=390850 RepID=A0ACB0Y7W8_MELEN